MSKPPYLFRQGALSRLAKLLAKCSTVLFDTHLYVMGDNRKHLLSKGLSLRLDQGMAVISNTNQTVNTKLCYLFGAMAPIFRRFYVKEDLWGLYLDLKHNYCFGRRTIPVRYSSVTSLASPSCLSEPMA